MHESYIFTLNQYSQQCTSKMPYALYSMFSLQCVSTRQDAKVIRKLVLGKTLKCEVKLTLSNSKTQLQPTSTQSAFMFIS